MAFTPQQPPSNIKSELSRYLFSEFQRLALAAGVTEGASGALDTIAVITGPTTWEGEGIASVAVVGQSIRVTFAASAGSSIKQTVVAAVESGNSSDSYRVDYDFVNAARVDLYVRLVSVTPPIKTTKFPISIVRKAHQ